MLSHVSLAIGCEGAKTLAFLAASDLPIFYGQRLVGGLWWIMLECGVTSCGGCEGVSTGGLW